MLHGALYWPTPVSHMASQVQGFFSLTCLTQSQLWVLAFSTGLRCFSETADIFRAAPSSWALAFGVKCSALNSTYIKADWAPSGLLCLYLATKPDFLIVPGWNRGCWFGPHSSGSGLEAHPPQGLVTISYLPYIPLTPLISNNGFASYLLR